MESNPWLEEFLQANQRTLNHLRSLQKRLQARLEIMKELTKQNDALQDPCTCVTSSHCYCHDSSHPASD